MSYDVLQQAVTSLKEDNQTLGDRLIDSTGASHQLRLDVSQLKEQARANRKLIDPMPALAQAQRTQTEAARDAGQNARSASVAPADAAEAQVPLAQTQVARAVAVANAKQLIALGSEDYLASVKGLVQPSLVLDFAKGEYWKQGKYPWNKVELDPATDLTFSRASTATYWDKDGVLRTAGVDEMRIDHDPLTGECLGVLLEPTRTNHLRYSEATTSGSAFNCEVSLDGNNHMVITRTSESNQAWFRIGHGALSPGVAGGSVGDPVTLWADVMAGNVSRVMFNTKSSYAHIDDRDINFDLSTLETSSVNAYVIPLGGGVFRCVYITSLRNGGSSGTQGSFGIGPNSRTGSLSASLGGDVGDYITVIRAQAERGPYPTSYIPTNGAAVTRSRDLIEQMDVSPYLSKDSGSFLIEGRELEGALSGSSSEDTFVYLGTSHTNGMEVRLSSDVARGVVFRSGNISALTTARDSTIMIAGGSYSKDTLIGAVSGTSRSGDLVRPVDPLLSIGHQGNGLRALSGHIKRATIYPHALSATELEALTLPVEDTE